MTRPTMTDVTDKWEGKTSCGYPVVMVQTDGKLLFSFYEFRESLWCAKLCANGKVSATGCETELDLIPKKPPRTPLERILPFVDHWWRGKGGPVCRISGIDDKANAVRLADFWVYASEACATYEHAVAIPGETAKDWKWEKVPE